MENNTNVKKNKKNKRSLRIVLGVIISLVFALSVDMMFWACGILGTPISIVIGILLNLVFLFSVWTILWNGVSVDIFSLFEKLRK